MDLCDECERLTRTSGRVDVPVHLSRMAILKKDAKLTFRYQCPRCSTPWNWSHGMGWHTDLPPVPLLSRLGAAARLRIHQVRNLARH